MTYQPVLAATEIETRFTRQKSARMKERFLKGPIPLDQIAHAAKLPGKSLSVYLAVHHQTALTRREQVTLPKGLLTQLGVSRDAKARALTELQNAGLIQVERRRGKSSLVTLSTNSQQDRLVPDRFANLQWMVTEGGISCLEHHYDIAKSQLTELRGTSGSGIAMWPLQMAEKSWVDVESFIAAFENALIVHRPIGVEKLDLPASFAMARETAARRKSNSLTLASLG